MSENTRSNRKDRNEVLVAIAEASLYISNIADERHEHEIVKMLSKAYQIVAKSNLNR